MGKIVISQNVTLDGVVQDPTGDDGFQHGGWFNQALELDFPAWAEAEMEEALNAEALLLGRRSDAYFGPRWIGRDGPFADRLNSLPKYVVSSTVSEAQWGNATILSGDAVEEAAKLRQQIDGEIIVYASRQLVHALMDNGLVDEIRVIVFPFVLGVGDRLFGDMSDKASLRRLSVQPLGAGLVYTRYEVVRTA
ncbi:MAG TPA: dihydrofolate reductase family protein [Conexibacter sp.]|jgi:dihydrofolate reductase